MTVAELTTEARQYVETALWTETTLDNGTPLDEQYDADDIAAEALESMASDVAAFCADETLAEALEFWRSELGDGQIGHDFWLTRNGHGAGFWDRFSGDQIGARYGALLTAAAKVYGESDLYVGDDGKVYVS